MAGLKPIMHGKGDPCEIPYYCKKCKFFEKSGSDFPRCTNNETGRFKPDVCYTCFRSKETGQKLYL
jgi:hypothetical protein